MLVERLMMMMSDDDADDDDEIQLKTSYFKQQSDCIQQTTFKLSN